MKETDSIHVHLVSEFPNDYAHGAQLITWAKHVNDFLYLSGLEEGLHPNELTGVAGQKRSTWGLGNIFLEKSVLKLPRRLKDIKAYNFKMLGMGLRRQIYGDAIDPKAFKMGLELRDVTRDLARLENYAEDIGDSYAMRVWEKGPDSFGGYTLDPGLDAATALWKESPLRIREPFLKKLHKLDPMVAIPLREFEKENFYDYVSHDLKGVSPDHAKKISDARKGYILSLEKLEREFNRYQAKGEKVENELLQSALRMNLSEWATAAQASKLFRKF
jgi:hypothetical protein